MDKAKEMRERCEAVKRTLRKAANSGLILTGNGCDSQFDPLEMAKIAIALKERNVLNRALELREVVQVVRCRDCCKYQTAACHAGHEQAETDYCSHGVRKDGTE